MALVITPEGFPLAYEVMDGNTSDKTTLRGFLERIEGLYGKAAETLGSGWMYCPRALWSSPVPVAVFAAVRLAAAIHGSFCASSVLHVSEDMW